MWSTILGLGAYLVIPKVVGKLREQKIQVIHAIPGRLRLQNNRWKDQQIGAYLEKALQKHPLIKSCRATPITGSLTLEFTTPYLQQEDLDHIFQIITDTTIESFSHTKDKALQTMSSLFNGVNKNAKKMTNGYASIDSMMIVYFMFQGLRSFPTNPAFASSLFYWAYTVLKNSDEKG
ncbi:HMA2 domain-containing protein [Niallia endozanthoxylica]|uniref:Uncharacterized protein n=1 Tax=Niallia endozanthoxylica TaxID=2036016 RepID=A0A5J5I765_9BACI|nr:hypothetical protein [Niallia endozanthoxylica]KAA9030616.1 hypothetical protein F4V44_02135 [Niallia endozanthoxylica]